METADKSSQENYAGKHLYELSFSNKGGLVMPIILEWTYADGTKEIERIPAQIWRKNEGSLKKLFIKSKEVTGIRLDPMLKQLIRMNPITAGHKSQALQNSNYSRQGSRRAAVSWWKPNAESAGERSEESVLGISYQPSAIRILH